MMTRRCTRAIAAVILSAAVSAGAGEDPAMECDVEITHPGRRISIENPSQPLRPTIYIVGVPDTTASPPRLTQGVTLQGCRLTERLLSESVLIVRPDGTGDWGYHGGFEVFRLPSERPPRETVEYGKYRYDPLFPPRVFGNDINLLSLRPVKGDSAIAYEIAFPSAIKIKRLKVTSSTAGFTKGRIIVEAFADEGLTKRIASHETDAAESTTVRAALDLPEPSRVFLSIRAADCGGTWPSLYRTTLEAELDTKDVQIPILKTGKNTWRYSDDKQSSHRARIVVRWVPRPQQEWIWDELEDTSSWKAEGLEARTADLPPGPFTGRGYTRLSFVVEGRRPAYVRKMDGVNLTRCNRLAIAHRRPRGLRYGIMWLEIANRDGGIKHFYLRPKTEWQFSTFDISECARDAVDSVAIRFLDTHWRWRRGDEFVLDVDTLCFYRDESPKQPESPPYPPHVANYVSPFRNASAPKRKLPPVQEWFPMGIYTGPCPPPVSEFILDDMRRHNMNTWYISNGNLDFARRIVDEAERRGIRVIYQGTSSTALYYIHYESAARRREMFRNNIAPSARKFVPTMRGRWGLVAWSLTEEIKPEVVEDIADYYALIRDLDPTHPPTVLHNNPAAAERDLEVNRPAVVTYDFYPFYWDPRSGPTTPARSLSMLRDRLDKFYKPVRKAGASLWLMPQVHGDIHRKPLDPPGYRFLTGYRPPTLAELSQQAWIGIAHGATGVMYYTYHAPRPDFVTFRDHNWKPTPRLAAVGKLFGTLRGIAPLLCRLERDYEDENLLHCDNAKIVCHTFVKRPGFEGKGRYVVAASLDAFGPQRFKLDLPKGVKMFDMVRRTEVKRSAFPLELQPGWGGLYLLGGKDDFAADVEMIDELLKRYYE